MTILHVQLQEVLKSHMFRWMLPFILVSHWGRSESDLSLPLLKQSLGGKVVVGHALVVHFGQARNLRKEVNPYC